MSSEPALAHASSPATGDARRSSALFSLIYLLFIVYGSLIPFEPRALNGRTAFDVFWQATVVDPAVGSRADLVANLILYVPLGFFWVAAIWPRLALLKPIAVMLAWSAACALAVAVEYAQVYYIRTVTGYDLAAEITGAAIGVLIFVLAGRQLLGLWAAIAAGGRPAFRALLIAYLLAYLFFNLFPYDFVVTAEELLRKLNATLRDPMIDISSCGDVTRCGFKILAEVVTVVPLGLLLGILLGGTRRRGYWGAAWTGIGLGMAIEIAQLFILSGISQLGSVVTRAVGAVLGVAVYRAILHLGAARIRRLAKFVVVLAALPYLAVLLILSGWWSSALVDLDVALNKLDGLNFLPFYYHYFTDEQRALKSLATQALMYAPIGFAWWAWRSRTPEGRRPGNLGAAVLAAMIATATETGKLFFAGTRPDPTNVLIAAVSVVIVYTLLRWCEEWGREPVLMPPRRPGSMGIDPAHREAKR